MVERWYDFHEFGGHLGNVGRNALAHGSVVHLDENGREEPGSEVRHLAFLSKSRGEDIHRVAIFGEEDFLAFLKAWILWVKTFDSKTQFVLVMWLED